jgi:hypothetical protein
MNTLCGMIFIGNVVINSCQISYVEFNKDMAWPNNDVECFVRFGYSDQIAFTKKEHCDELATALAKQDDGVTK